MPYHDELLTGVFDGMCGMVYGVGPKGGGVGLFGIGIPYAKPVPVVQPVPVAQPVPVPQQQVPATIVQPIVQPVVQQSKPVTYAQPIIQYTQPIVQPVTLPQPVVSKQQLQAQPIVESSFQQAPLITTQPIMQQAPLMRKGGNGLSGF